MQIEKIEISKLNPAKYNPRKDLKPGDKDPKQIDKQFKNNINGAKSVGIHTGVYHYSYADSVDDAINEA